MTAVMEAPTSTTTDPTDTTTDSNSIPEFQFSTRLEVVYVVPDGILSTTHYAQSYRHEDINPERDMHEAPHDIIMLYYQFVLTTITHDESGQQVKTSETLKSDAHYPITHHFTQNA